MSRRVSDSVPITATASGSLNPNNLQPAASFDGAASHTRKVEEIRFLVEVVENGT